MSHPAGARGRRQEPSRGGYRPRQRTARGDRPLASALTRVRHGVDKLAALVALVLALPVLAAMVLTLRARGQGPVLTTQTRIGVWGRTFRMVTFEGHWPAAPSATEAPASSVAGSGSVLRRTLGRLPQLVNVLRGDMGLVGPRAPRPEELARALHARPGLVTLRRSGSAVPRKAHRRAVATNH